MLKLPSQDGLQSWTERRGKSISEYKLIQNKKFTVNNVEYDCIGVESLITEANVGVWFRNWYAIDVGLVAFEWRMAGGGWIEYVMEKP